MGNSPHYRQLKTRLAVLRRNLLPKSFSPVGNYKDYQLDRARAYRLLVHAEFEHYFEDIAWGAVTSRLKRRKLKGEASELLVSLALGAFANWSTEADAVELGQLFRKAKPKDAIDEVINRTVASYRLLLDSNNGIRGENLRKMLVPLGVDFRMVDDTWLTDIDQFGKDRGDVAHKTVGVTSPVDPAGEYQKVTHLFSGLNPLDDQIVKLGGL